jgi:hypothetical protein
MEPNPLPNPASVQNSTATDLADDLLRGADEIAEFIFGTRGSRRKVYYLAETSRLPVFRTRPVRAALRGGGERA